jgi:hypothetical protein
MAIPLLLQRQIAVCTICFLSSFGHAQDVLWEKSYGGKHAEYLTDAVATADYGFILAGSSLSSKSGNKTSLNEGDLDYWLWKMDESGEMEWQKSFGGSGSDLLQSIKLTKDGGFILAGISDSPKGKSKTANSQGGTDFWIIKLDAGGGEQWQRTIGGVGNEKLSSICQTKDGGFLVGGSTYSEKSGDKTEKGFGNSDCWIIKLDSEGNIGWQKTFGGKFYDDLRSLEQTRDGGYIIGSYSNSPLSGNKTDDNIGIGDYWIFKLDRNGEIEWQKVIGGDKDDQLFSLHQTIDGGFIFGGNSNSQSSYNKSKSNGKGTDFWIVKTDVDGKILWQETYDFGTSDILTSIVENKDGTLLIGGFAKSEPNTEKDDKGINDYIAFKISKKGDLLWYKTVGSAGNDVLKKLIETRDGGYLLAGTSNPVRFASHGKIKNGKGLQNGQNALLNNGQVNQQLQNATAKANDEINKVTDNLNQTYKENMNQVTDGIEEATGLGKDSPLKLGIESPNNPIGNFNLGNGSNGQQGNPNDAPSSSSSDQLQPASGDKSRNYGDNDFWVVKLKDKAKASYEKQNSIEAMPNPTSDYTNVIINYDYQSGTASVVDLSGHLLEQFEIKDRTVPVNLSKYPEGIYVVNIKTNVQSDGIRVVKKSSK